MSEASGDIAGEFLSMQRLEALSDGIFVVALTVLVLELKLNHLPIRVIGGQVVRILTFVLSNAFGLLQHRNFPLLARLILRRTPATSP